MVTWETTKSVTNDAELLVSFTLKRSSDEWIHRDKKKSSINGDLDVDKIPFHFQMISTD